MMNEIESQPQTPTQTPSQTPSHGASQSQPQSQIPTQSQPDAPQATSTPSQPEPGTAPGTPPASSESPAQLSQQPPPAAEDETPVQAGPETISSRIGRDIVTAMKARDEHRLTTLRMVKSALKSREIDTRKPLTGEDEARILSTLIKQRKDSIESFTKGNRPELAEKEQVEIAFIELYLPQAAGEDEIRHVIHGAIAHLAADGSKPGPKDVGPAMRVIRQRLLASGIRADGSLVNKLLQEELAR